MLENVIINKIDRIIFVDRSEYPETHTTYNSNLLSCELIYHLSGEVEVMLGQKNFLVKKDSLRFMSKGEHNRYEVYRHEPCDCIDIFFQTEQPLDEESFIINVSQNAKIAPLFQKIFIAWNTKKPGYYHKCMELLYRILYETQTSGNYHSSRQLNLIKPALKEIESHFLQETISCKELANLCNISYSYFKRIFQDLFNLSPQQYIYQLKINYAKDLLLLNTFTVTQIAEQVGFSDVYFFSRQFKNHVGVSPTEYVKKYKSSK